MASIIVPVTFTGEKSSATVQALVDTGAESNILSQSLAERIGVPILGSGKVYGVGKARIKVGVIQSIQVPGTKCKAGRGPILVFPDNSPFFGGRFQFKAVLGMDFMRKAKMMIAAFQGTRAIRCRG